MSSNPIAISAFDLDGTLLRYNSSFRFSLHLIVKRKLSLFTFFRSIVFYFKHSFGFLSLFDMHQKVFTRYLKGLSFKDLKEEVVEFIGKIKDKDYYIPALDHLNRAKEAGHYILLLSSSPNFLVEPLGELLGVDETFASCYEVDNEGKLCHISSVLDGEGKATIFERIAREKSVDLEQMVAYSDSYIDLEFLESAQNPVAVIPDRKLKKHAMANNWLVL